MASSKKSVPSEFEKLMLKLENQVRSESEQKKSANAWKSSEPRMIESKDFTAQDKAMWQAIEKGILSEVIKLVAAGARVNLVNFDNALSLAVKSKSEPVLDWMIEQWRQQGCLGGEEPAKALEVAIRWGSDHTARKLIAAGAPMEKRSEGADSMLMIAAIHGRFELVADLKPRSNPLHRNERGCNAMHMAAMFGWIEWVEWLSQWIDPADPVIRSSKGVIFQRKDLPKDWDWEDPLTLCASNGRYEEMERLEACALRLLEIKGGWPHPMGVSKALDSAASKYPRLCAALARLMPGPIRGFLHEPDQSPLMIAAIHQRKDCVEALWPSCDPAFVDAGGHGVWEWGLQKGFNGSETLNVEMLEWIATQLLILGARSLDQMKAALNQASSLDFKEKESVSHALGQAQAHYERWALDQAAAPGETEGVKSGYRL